MTPGADAANGPCTGEGLLTPGTGNDDFTVTRDGYGAIAVEPENGITPTSAARVTTDPVPNPDGRTIG